jgi:hypothetical protein
VSRPISTSELVQLAGAHHARGPGQVGPAVHPDRLVVVVQAQHLQTPPLSQQHLDDAGDVDLALGVVVADLGEGLPQQVLVHQVDAGIALLDGELLRRGVRRLDDALQVPGGVANHDAGDVHRGREHHQVGALLGLELRHAPERLRAQQWRVAVEHQHVPVEAVQLGLGLEHGVAGATLLLLEGEAGPAAEGVADGLCAVTHHHHQPSRSERLGSGQGEVEHGPASQGVEDLGQPRLHAGALARGQHDDGDFARRGGHRYSSSATRGGDMTIRGGWKVPPGGGGPGEAANPPFPAAPRDPLS